MGMPVHASRESRVLLQETCMQYIADVTRKEAGGGRGHMKGVVPPLLRTAQRSVSWARPMNRRTRGLPSSKI